MFIDDCTRTTWVYLKKNKSEVPSIFIVFHKFIKTQFGTNVRTLRSDNGKEYFNQELRTYLSAKGILHQSMCIDTPHQNGVMERKNRHLHKVNQSLLFQTGVPKYFQGEAILIRAYLINRMPTRVLENQSPVNFLTALFPNLQGVGSLPPKVFGGVPMSISNPIYKASLIIKP